MSIMICADCESYIDTDWHDTCAGVCMNCYNESTDAEREAMERLDSKGEAWRPVGGVIAEVASYIAQDLQRFG